MNKVNVYGSFTQFLLFSGQASIPKYLLDRYVNLGLDDREMLILIHIIAIGEGGAYISPDALSKKMSASAKEIEEALVRLVEKKIITIEKSWNEEKREWINHYSFLGLMEELSEQWAIEQVRLLQAEQSRKSAGPSGTPEQTNPPAQPSSNIINIFEHELGRPLTEMECDYIKGWQHGASEELIIEALRRGVSAGIRNFRYLDSILREWDKKGLRTKEEVLADDLHFQNRQEEKTKAKGAKGKKATPGKYENFYL